MEGTGFISNHFINLQGLVREKHSSLFVQRVSNTEKKFCYIETRIRFDCIDGLKTFLLFLLVLGPMLKNILQLLFTNVRKELECFPWQAFPD
jgi:hypothetical protein